jgi:FdrA protein
MSLVRNLVRPNLYLDSVALMRCSREIAALDGIEEAALMMATPANQRIMADAGVLTAEGEGAAPGDLVIALRARDEAAAGQALAAAEAFLARPAGGAKAGEAWQPKTLRAALKSLPEASLALISVPGDYAAAEARKALRRGLDVMIFSDNVPIEQEIALKQEAWRLGRLVMGPDCGTAIVQGVPLAFANTVPRGDIGIIGASGTGIQEVSTLIARGGHGISHALGTGGRDLKAEVGGLSTLAAIDLLEADPGTRHIVLISKPPAELVARRIVQRLAGSAKSFTLCFLGSGPLDLPANARQAATLREAACLALGRELPDAAPGAPDHPPLAPGRTQIEGLFAGGSLCAEAQVIMRAEGLEIASNVPLPGVLPLAAAGEAHRLIDLGDDDYTRGRPHPMIDPSVRDAAIEVALADDQVGVVLLDLVLGFGAHADPAGHLAACLARHAADGRLIVASVTGTEADPQPRSAQVEKLARVGVRVAGSNAEAVQLAIAGLRRRP